MHALKSLFSRGWCRNERSIVSQLSVHTRQGDTFQLNLMHLVGGARDLCKPPNNNREKNAHKLESSSKVFPQLACSGEHLEAACPSICDIFLRGQRDASNLSRIPPSHHPTPSYRGMRPSCLVCMDGDGCFRVIRCDRQIHLEQTKKPKTRSFYPHKWTNELQAMGYSGGDIGSWAPRKAVFIRFVL